MPSRRMAATTSAINTPTRDQGNGFNRRSRTVRSIRAVLVTLATFVAARFILGVEAPAHGPEDEDQRDRHADIEPGHHEHSHPYAVVGGRRVANLEMSDDDPRLAADLCHHPTGLHGHHRGRA